MADRWAVAAGNWSNTATWDGGTLPGAGDDVFADGRAVTIDQNITVLSIRTTQRSGGTAGGTFTAAAGTLVFTCDVISGTTDCLIFSAASSNYTLNGNVTGGASTNADGVRIGASSSTTVTINGNVTGGSAATAHGVNQTASTIVAINGNVTGGTNSTARGVAQSAGTSTITGNITGATSQAVNFAGGTLTITTDSVTATGTASPITISGGVATVNCSTTITGSSPGIGGMITVSGTSTNAIINANLLGNGTNEHALRITDGAVRVNGNITGSSAATNGYGVSLSTGSLFVVGDVVAGLATAIQQDSGSVVVVGNVTGGSNALGDGIMNESSPASFTVVYGTVTGGSVASAFGVENTGAATVYVLGETVAGVAAATSNTGSGSITTVAIGGGGGGSSLPLIGPGGLVY